MIERLARPVLAVLVAVALVVAVAMASAAIGSDDETGEGTVSTVPAASTVPSPTLAPLVTTAITVTPPSTTTTVTMPSPSSIASTTTVRVTTTTVAPTTVVPATIPPTVTLATVPPTTVVAFSQPTSTTTPLPVNMSEVPIVRVDQPPVPPIASTTTTLPVPTTTIVHSPEAVVAYVVDGDTIVVDIGVDRFTIRLVGIDTPEREQCGWGEATEAMRALVDGKTVELYGGAHADADPFGRLLRYVFVDGIDAGLEQIKNGYAIARYDSRDGYGPHTHEASYIAADEASEPFCSQHQDLRADGPTGETTIHQGDTP